MTKRGNRDGEKGPPGGGEPKIPMEQGGQPPVEKPKRVRKSRAKGNRKPKADKPVGSTNPTGLPYIPNSDHATIVKLCMLNGFTQEQTARMVPRYSEAQKAQLIPPPEDIRRGITVETLQKYYSPELEHGRAEMIALCSRNLFRIATLGLAPGTTHDRSTVSAIQAILRNRGGAAWQEPAGDNIPEPTALTTDAKGRPAVAVDKDGKPLPVRRIYRLNIGDAKPITEPIPDNDRVAAAS